MRFLPFLVLLILSFQVPAQDVCRDTFVSCVEQTGNSFACRSTYTNCLAGQGQDLVATATSPSEAQTKELVFAPELTELAGGISTVRLWVSNPGNYPVQVNTLSYPVNCEDGFQDRAVFFMDGTIDAGARNHIVSTDQVVCLGHGKAVAIESIAASIDGLASMQSQLEFEFPCANGEYRWIHLAYDANKKIYRWNNNAGFEGVLNQDFIQQSAFADRACEPLKPGAASFVSEAVKQIDHWFDSPPPGKQVRYKHSVIGPRG